MKKRILAAICTLCCVFAIFSVFSGCYITPSANGNIDVDTSANSSGSSETLTDENIGNSNADNTKNDDDSVTLPDEEFPDDILGPMVCYGNTYYNFVNLENYLKRIGANNPINCVFFNVDNGLPCYDQTYYCIGEVEYIFEAVVNVDLFDADSYVFDWGYEISVSFKTESLLPPPDMPNGGSFSVTYSAVVVELPIVKDDIHLVETSLGKSGYKYEIYVGEELAGVLTISCDDEVLEEIIQQLFDRMVILSNLY